MFYYLIQYDIQTISSFKPNSVLLLLILISVFRSVVSEVDLEFKTVDLQYNTTLLVDRYSLTSPGMVFGTCSPASKSKNRFCTFVLETTKPLDSPDHLRFCNVTLKSKVRYEEIHDIDRVVALGKDKAIVVWSNQELFKKFTIVHFDDCTTYAAKIDSGIDIKSGRIVAVHDDMFDVIETYDKHSSCKHSEFCKMTMDDQGNMVTGLLPWGDKRLSDTLVDLVYSPLKGHLIVDANSWMTKVRVIAEKDFRTIKKFQNHFTTRLLLRTPSVSATHQMLTVCYEYDFSSFQCSHFGLNGHMKFELLLYIHTTLESSITVHNLPDGGFVLLNGAFYYNNYFCKNCFTVAKVDAGGNKVGNKDFVYLFPYKYRFDFREVHFHVNENGKYCLSHPFERDRKESGDGFQVTLTIICFDDSDLIAESA